MLSLNLKIVLLGDYAVGKTSIVQRYANEEFKNDYKPTLGFDVLIKHLVVRDKPVSLSIWDIGAGMGFKHLRSNYIRGCHGCLLVCDLTRRESFDNLGQWLEEIHGVGPGTPFLLVGNKVDLPHQVITGSQIAQKAASIGAIKGILASAKDGYQIEDAFETLVHKIIWLAEVSPTQ